MERRRWESRQKFEVVLVGIKSGKISEICNQYQISQAQYHRWRDEFLKKGHRVLEMNRESIYSGD